MSTTDTAQAIRRCLDTIAALGLPPGELAAILTKLQTLGGRLDLALDRLADALDPAPCGR
jgi:hypothetical protein